MKRRLPVILLLVLVGIMTTGNVYACSGGGGTTWDELLPQIVDGSDTIVLGRFVELDDAQANGIFQVEAYFLGSGAEHLTIAVSDIREIEHDRTINRIFLGSCISLTPRFQTEGQYVFFLTRNTDGTYHERLYRYFASPEATFTFRSDIEIDLQMLQSQIISEVGHAPIEPDENTMYPRTTPIIVTTRTGQQYLLPVDGTAPIHLNESEAFEMQRDQRECSSPPCTVFAPNGVDVVQLMREGDTPLSTPHTHLYLAHNVEGKRISMSSTSETFVLWQNNELQLHMFWYPAYEFPNSGYYPRSWVEQANSISVDTSSLSYPAAWSPDGRTLAFSDDNGLWLWDVFSVDYPPQLLLPRVGNDIPVARYYSPQGRYLAVTVGDERYNLDLVTRRELPDGYISPNDRVLLVFDTAAQGATTLEVAYLAPGVRQATYYDGLDYYQVQWIDNRRFLAAVGGNSFIRYETGEQLEDGGWEAIPFVVENPFSIVMSFYATEINSDQQVPFPVEYTQNETDFYQTNPVNRFVYDENNGLIAFFAGSCSITVNDTVIDLLPYLPEPIVSAEWLPSAFYYEDEN
jgi:hypothetical protein